MALYNPYKNYDQGMDDAYMGIEPNNPKSQQYMQGYDRCQELLDEEDMYTVQLNPLKGGR